jgi:hypothetical protein
MQPLYPLISKLGLGRCLHVSNAGKIPVQAVFRFIVQHVSSLSSLLI